MHLVSSCSHPSTSCLNDVPFFVIRVSMFVSLSLSLYLYRSRVSLRRGRWSPCVVMVETKRNETKRKERRQSSTLHVPRCRGAGAMAEGRGQRAEVVTHPSLRPPCVSFPMPRKEEDGALSWFVHPFVHPRSLSLTSTPVGFGCGVGVERERERESG